MITGFTLLAALAILGWGFYRARPFGKLGILAWLQSVVLMLPWLLFFGGVAVGIPINLAGVLLLLLVSISLYILLGRRLRQLAKEQPFVSQELPPTETTLATDTLSAAESGSSEASANPTPEMATLPPVPAADLKAIQGIFGLDTFFVTETIPYQDGAVFRGNLRGEAAEVHERLMTSLQQQLPDQYRLYLVADQEGKPVVIVLPSRNDPQPLNLLQRGLAVVLCLVTIATCLETVSFLLDFDLFTTPTRIVETLPIGLGILSILAVHELGHQVMARRHNVKFSLPFFIPVLQVGSFGALNRFLSLVPNRQVLFDVALGGPAAAGILALVLLVTGLLLSNAQSLFQVPSLFFQSSILVGTLSRVVLGEALQQPIVAVHPLVVVGWLGLVITAINLMPAGQLDGGRITQAIYGRKVAGRTTIATLILLAIASLSTPLALYWAIVIIFLQRDLERPSLNEITEPDDARAAWGLLALFLMAATLIPLAPGLAGRLGIGG